MELERHRQVVINQLVHLSHNSLFVFTVRLAVENPRNLALLPLYMCIVRPLAAKQTLHHLVQQMLSCMCGRKLVFVVIVQYVVVHI